MVQTHFADTVLNINLTANLVRFDLGTVLPVQAADGKQELRGTPTQQLVMPLEGFLHAFGLQEQLVRKLVADGVIKAQQAEENALDNAQG